MRCILAGTRLGGTGFPSRLEKLLPGSPVTDAPHRNQPYGRLSVARENDFVASLSAPHQFGQLPFGIAYRNLHMAFPWRLTTATFFGPNDSPSQVRSEKLDLRLTAEAKRTLHAAAKATQRYVSEFVLDPLDTLATAPVASYV